MKENIPSLPLALSHGHTQQKIREPKDRTSGNFCAKCGFWFYPAKKEERTDRESAA